MPKNLLPILLALIFGVGIGVFSTMLLSDDAGSLDGAGDSSAKVEKSLESASRVEKSENNANRREHTPSEQPKPEAVESVKGQISFDHLKAANGTISGRVYDMEGKPVSGAKVIALGGFYDHGLEQKIQAASTREEYRKHLNKYNAALEAWQAVARLETTSDAQGRYAFKGLYKVGYLVEARVEGKEVISRSKSQLYPPATRDFFVANLHEIPVNVLMPDGSQAKSATFSFSDPHQANRNMERNLSSSMSHHLMDYRGYRFDGNTPNPKKELAEFGSLEWSKASPTIRLREGVFAVHALFEDADGNWLRSETINILALKDAKPEHYVFQLKEAKIKRTNSATISLDFQGSQRLETSEYHFTMTPLFDDAAAHRARHTFHDAFECLIRGIQAGRHEIDVFIGERLIAREEVEVKEGKNTFAVSIPALDQRDFIVATIEGVLPHKRKELNFQLGYVMPKKQYENVPERHSLAFYPPRQVYWQDDGSVWIPLPTQEKGEIPQEGRAYLFANFRAYVYLSGMQHQKVKLKIPPRGRLKVKLTNYDARNGLHPFVDFDFRKIEEEGDRDPFARDQTYISTIAIDSQGVLVAYDLEPGTYDLVPKLNTDASRLHRFAPLVRVEVKGGLNEVSFAIPRFHSVNFLLPENAFPEATKGSSHGVWLQQRLKDSLGPFRQITSFGARVGEKVGIGHIPTGKYYFQIDDQIMETTISRAGTVTFVPNK